LKGKQECDGKTNAGTCIQHHTALHVAAALYFGGNKKRNLSCNCGINSPSPNFSVASGSRGNLGLRGSALHLNQVLGRTGSNIVGLLQLPQDVTTVTHSFTQALTQDVLRVREKVYEVRIPCSISPRRDSSYLFSSSLSTT